MSKIIIIGALFHRFKFELSYDWLIAVIPQEMSVEEILKYCLDTDKIKRIPDTIKSVEEAGVSTYVAGNSILIVHPGCEL